MASLSQFIGKPMLCFISDQPMPNLIAVKLLKPSYLVILHTDTERYRPITKILHDYAKKILPNPEVKTDITSPYSVQDNYEKVKKWVGILGREVTVNVTGGTKLMALGSFRATIDMGALPVYVDSTNNHLINLNDESDTLPLPSLSVPEILFGHRAEIVKDKTDFFLSNPAMAEMGKYLVKNADDWDRLHNYFHSQLKKNAKEYQLKPKPHEFESLVRMLTEFENQGFLHILKVDNDRIIFFAKNKEIKKLLWDKGEWLEAYVFFTARELGFDDVRAGVELLWNQYASISPENELDTLISVGSKLSGISCKFVGEEDKNHLNELEVYLRRFGGTFANKVLAITRPRNAIEDKFLERAKEMGINILALDDLQADDFPLRLKNAVMGKGGAA